MVELSLDKINAVAPYQVQLENYAALIIRRDNPKFIDLVTEFTNTITLLNAKPD